MHIYIYAHLILYINDEHILWYNSLGGVNQGGINGRRWDVLCKFLTKYNTLW